MGGGGGQREEIERPRSMACPFAGEFFGPRTTEPGKERKNRVGFCSAKSFEMRRDIYAGPADLSYTPTSPAAIVVPPLFSWSECSSFFPSPSSSPSRAPTLRSSGSPDRF